LELDSKEEQEMSKSKTPPISRREVLIGGAATVAVVGLPFRLLPGNPNPRALPRHRNKMKETFT